MIPPENSPFYGADDTYRYWLHRSLDEAGNNGSHILFIMLNPSTACRLADGVEGNPNDNTISRCMNLARQWQGGYTDLTVVNLFALRGADPRILLEPGNPIGEHNNAAIEWAIQEIQRTQGKVICAWGNCGAFMCRNCYVLEKLRHHNLQSYCLCMTRERHPKHPLFFTGNDNPVPYNPYL